MKRPDAVTRLGRRGAAVRKAAVIGSVLLTFAAVLAAGAWAATPRSGFWCKDGACGGDRGAASGDGEFAVANHRVKGLTVYEGCVKNDVVAPNMKIQRNGTFSFKGYGERYTNGPPVRVKLKVEGKFVTSTKSSITLTIGYDHCGTRHSSVPFATG